MILFLMGIAFAQSLQTQVLDDPMVSFHCKELITDRQDKIEIKQKLATLVIRNKDLLKVAPSNKKTSIVRLQVNLKKLERQHYDAVVRIKTMEENIIRNGCPGINL